MNEHDVIDDFLVFEVVCQEYALYDIISRNRPKLRNDIVDVKLVALLQHEKVTLAVRLVRVDQPLQLEENVTLLILAITSSIVGLRIAEQVLPLVRAILQTAIEDDNVGDINFAILVARIVIIKCHLLGAERLRWRDLCRDLYKAHCHEEYAN